MSGFFEPSPSTERTIACRWSGRRQFLRNAQLIARPRRKPSSLGEGRRCPKFDLTPMRTFGSGSRAGELLAVRAEHGRAAARAAQAGALEHHADAIAGTATPNGSSASTNTGSSASKVMRRVPGQPAAWPPSAAKAAVCRSTKRPSAGAAGSARPARVASPAEAALGPEHEQRGGPGVGVRAVVGHHADRGQRVAHRGAAWPDRSRASSAGPRA